MNSAVGHSFKEKFAEFHTCGSREQCTRPNQKNADGQNATPTTIQTHALYSHKWHFLRNLETKKKTSLCDIITKKLKII